MTEIEKALETMRTIPLELQAASQSLPSAAITAHLRPLTEEFRRLESVVDNGAPPKAPIDPDLVWRKWERSAYSSEALDRREWRSLCVSPETACRPQLVEALLVDGEPLLRLSTLMGFAHSYFSLWGQIEDQPKVEALIARTLEREEIRRRGRVVARWRESRFLFTLSGADRLAESMATGMTNPDVVRESFFLQKGAGIVVKAVEVAARRVVDRLVEKARSVSEAVAQQELGFVRDILTTSPFNPALFRSLLSSLILSELPLRFTTVQTSLVQWVHDDVRLGDPRLSSRAPNWRSVDPAARSRFLTWLAKETLEFFFNTIVPENDENRRRAVFWIDYARAGLIRDFNVVVSYKDESLIRRSRAKFIPSYARLESSEAVQTSAFLMVLEGYGREYVVAEFSETGNAAHVCQRSLFEANGVKLHDESFRRREIHNVPRAELRILHTHSWEPNARRALANQLGIRL